MPGGGVRVTHSQRFTSVATPEIYFILSVFLICVICGYYAFDGKVFLFLLCLLFYSTAFSASPKTTKSSSALHLT